MLQFQQGEYCICIWERGTSMYKNYCTQQNCFIRIRMGCTSHLDRLEARYCKAQADTWQHRARQLEAEIQDLCSRAEALQDRIGWYRARYHELKEENRRLRARLARYAELEKKLNERKG